MKSKYNGSEKYEYVIAHTSSVFGLVEGMEDFMVKMDVNIISVGEKSYKTQGIAEGVMNRKKLKDQTEVKELIPYNMFHERYGKNVKIVKEIIRYEVIREDHHSIKVYMEAM